MLRQSLKVSIFALGIFASLTMVWGCGAASSSGLKQDQPSIVVPAEVEPGHEGKASVEASSITTHAVLALKHGMTRGIAGIVGGPFISAMHDNIMREEMEKRLEELRQAVDELYNFNMNGYALDPCKLRPIAQDFNHQMEQIKEMRAHWLLRFGSAVLMREDPTWYKQMFAVMELTEKIKGYEKEWWKVATAKHLIKSQCE